LFHRLNDRNIRRYDHRRREGAHDLTDPPPGPERSWHLLDLRNGHQPDQPPFIDDGKSPVSIGPEIPIDGFVKRALERNRDHGLHHQIANRHGRERLAKDRLPSARLGCGEQKHADEDHPSAARQQGGRQSASQRPDDGTRSDYPERHAKTQPDGSGLFRGAVKILSPSPKTSAEHTPAVQRKSRE